MSKLQAPQFLENLYRDLRDRRLLLPALALIIALVAVPVALRESSSATPPPAPSSAGSNVAETVPAVLAEDTSGVRDFRERLDRLQSKNPFVQQFQLPTVTESTLSTDNTSTTSSDLSVDGGGGSGVTATDAGGIPTPDSSSTGSSAATSTPSSTGAPSGGVKPAPEPKTVTKLITRRINVMVGPEGDVEKRENVKQLAVLPSETTPVVAFLGVSEDGNRAAFVVSSDATPVSGDGTCVPSGTSCMFIVLKPGESYTLDYAPDSLTYKLKLLRIRDVELKQH